MRADIQSAAISASRCFPVNSAFAVLSCNCNWMYPRTENLNTNRLSFPLKVHSWAGPLPPFLFPFPVSVGFFNQRRSALLGQRLPFHLPQFSLLTDVSLPRLHGRCHDPGPQPSSAFWASIIFLEWGFMFRMVMISLAPFKVLLLQEMTWVCWLRLPLIHGTAIKAEQCILSLQST